MLRRLSLLLVAFAVVPAPVAAAEFDFAAATNQAGLDVFRQLASSRPEQNLVISPYSIESAMALVYVGADGATREELAHALLFPRGDAALSAAMSALRIAFGKTAMRSPAIEWHAANRLYGQSGYAFRPAFLELMRDGLAAPLEQLDFRATPESARHAINSWVEEQTARKIRDLIPPGSVSHDTRLVLVNALYLKAPWETPFLSFLTMPLPFNCRDAARVEVATMQKTASLGYAKEPGRSVVSLDYLGHDLRFLVVLPDAGSSSDELAAKLTWKDFARWSRLGEKDSRERVALFLPKFQVKGATVSLREPLRALGIAGAFDEPRGSANFDRIAPRTADAHLSISDVFHQTFIALDENGTEAAAATAAVGPLQGAGPQQPAPIEVRVDRPFLFAIQHRASGACLFLGRIADPR